MGAVVDKCPVLHPDATAGSSTPGSHPELLGLPEEVRSHRTLKQLDSDETLQMSCSGDTCQPLGLETFQFCSANQLKPSPTALESGLHHRAEGPTRHVAQAKWHNSLWHSRHTSAPKATSGRLLALLTYTQLGISGHSGGKCWGCSEKCTFSQKSGDSLRHLRKDSR